MSLHNKLKKGGLIQNIEIEKKTLHFCSPFKIAYEEVNSAEIIFLKIIDNNGFVGCGSASPDTEVTGETIDGVLKILQKKLTEQFFEYDLKNWYMYHEKIQKIFKGYPSAQSAVEEAFLNLWSAKNNIHLKNFFGGYRDKCEIMITIGIKDLNETLNDVKKRLKEGFKIIKIKCGLDIANDISRIKAVRSIIPKSCKLILDANQGYSFKEAHKLVNEIGSIGVDLIEQPIAAEDWNGLKKLHKISPIPIIADESVISVEDAYNLLANDYVAGVNIKIMKCGGPINFIEIFRLAKELNKIIMIGCMYESNISITTGASLALALPIDYVDLDSGHLDFYDDPAIGGAIAKNGFLTLKNPLILSNNLNK